MTLEQIETLVARVEHRNLNLTESRDDWIRIAFAFADLGEAGRSLFHRLARMSDKYQWKANERQFNDALRTRGRSARPITIASFVQKCKDHGIELPASTRPKPYYLPKPYISIRKIMQHSQLTTHNSKPITQNPQPITQNSPLTTLFQQQSDLYHLELRPDGGVVYWTLDEQGNYRDGKVIFYGPDGHRDKSPQRHPQWVTRGLSREEAAELRQSSPCLFGQHLLSQFPEAPVAIVEAEKTAVIASYHLAEQGFVWLASGGESMLRVEHFQPLQHRRVILFPDTDPQGDTFRHWSAIAHEASLRYHMQIHVSRLLEELASPEQKAAKIDIADLLPLDISHPSTSETVSQ